MTTLPLVYDVGMNHGEDSAYYLTKGCRVIGIDANTDVCRFCQRRFEREIRSGQMIILNVGVSDSDGLREFYINVSKDKISTFLPDKHLEHSWAPKSWRPQLIRTTKLSKLIMEYGQPDFIKIDVEYFDEIVLRDLLLSGITPQYISAECHDMNCFELIHSMGYEKFKIVYGMMVHEDYGRMTITRADGSSIDYEFMYDTSGPYGDDLPGPWLTKEEAAATLAHYGLGWVDVHACR